MDLKKIELDIASREEGVWIALDDHFQGDADGLELRVRGLRCADAQKRFAALQTERTREQRKDPYARERREYEEFAEVMLEVCLLDWRGLTNDGAPTPYDPSLARAMLFNPAYELFHNLCRIACGVVDNRRVGAEEDAEKNSSDSSSEPSAATPGP